MLDGHFFLVKLLTISFSILQSRSLDRFSNSSLSHSSESSGETQNTFRIQPIPYTAPFRLAELSNSVNSNNQAINLSCRKEKNELVMQVNCTSSSSHLHGLQDILKDAKTSNVNVLVEEQESNNAIKFDSDKFPRHDIAKARELVNQNLMESYEFFDGKSVSVKRIKDTNRTNEQRDSENSESGGLDLKRIKLTEQNNCKKELISSALDRGESTEMSVVDRLKHPHNEIRLLSSNGKSVADCSSAGSSSSTHLTDAEDCVAMESFPENGESSNSLSGIKLKEDVLADHHWEKHLSSNQSTIADTFLGQFKSTVTILTHLILCIAFF